MPARTTTLDKTKETRNMVRYDANSGNESVATPTLYISKMHLPHPYPESISLTIEWNSDDPTTP